MPYSKDSHIKLSIIAAVSVLFIMILIPIPVAVLNILLVVYGSFVLFIFLSTLQRKNKELSPVLPIQLFLCTIFGFELIIPISRLSLINSADYNSLIIRLPFTFMSKFANTPGFITEIIIFTGLFILAAGIIICFLAKIPLRAFELLIDVLPQKQMAIDTSFKENNITSEEVIIRKNHLQKEIDFFRAVVGQMGFISAIAKAVFILLCICFIGHMVIAAIFQGESIILEETNGIMVSKELFYGSIKGEYLKTYLNTINSIIMTAMPTMYCLTMGFFLLQSANLVMAITASIVVKRNIKAKE